MVFGSILDRNFGRNRKIVWYRNPNRNAYQNRNFVRNWYRNRKFPITIASIGKLVLTCICSRQNIEISTVQNAERVREWKNGFLPLKTFWNLTPSRFFHVLKKNNRNWEDLRLGRFLKKHIIFLKSFQDFWCDDIFSTRL